MDVQRRTEGGFDKGTVRVEGLRTFAGSSVVAQFQNEYILAERVYPDKNKEILATVPDLISIIDSDTGEAIPTEEVRYGLRVSVIVLPCPPLLTTEKALKVVGPEAFGYGEYSYRPCSIYKECDPIPRL